MDHNDYRLTLRQHMAGAECPFPEAEFQRRRNAVLAAMQARGLDALLLTSPADIFYLTGYSTFEVSVHTALVFSERHLVLQVPSIETGPAVACTHVEDIRGYRWENVDEILDPLTDALQDMGATVGVDAWHGSLRHGVMSGLASRLPKHRFVDAAGILQGVRIVKSAAELDCLAESARITGLGIEASAKAVRAGITDSEIAGIGAQALHGAGSEFMSMQPIVVAGARSAVIHLNHQRRPIAEGEPVFLEFGSAWQRYTAPMMRTVVAGKPTPRMQEVFDTCRRIFDAMLGEMRPDKDFDAAARVAEQALAPLAAEVFHSGVFGYAVGAQFPPSWVEGSGFIARGQQRRFEENMVFHLPLCLRIPGAWGIGCSDTVRVTENGGVPLTDNPWTLTADA
ncbi:Xaa-Pro aminopeptidase [Modicisalibacter ilicicola DSM 19980]|uniref:Xaa-Pro aminopeptidase n=1 Tax=Modicisalibacter ilicicola DSM 19980 TaxID=1121942 RepID=A0A1M4Z8R3_9GAMM|nr:Xaa-Pro peptidase family protein [Halomonas ilicicola]SHF14395.1 Xaa-Pro aminopeptidase [Halomonas ilicicola DSM 19980]